jgi:hypothetical protein
LISNFLHRFTASTTLQTLLKTLVCDTPCAIWIS